MEASSEGFGEFVQSGNWLVRSWHEGEPFYTGSWRVDDRHEDQGSAQGSKIKGDPWLLLRHGASPLLQKRVTGQLLRRSNLGLPPRLPPGSVSIGVLELVLYWLAGANC